MKMIRKIIKEQIENNIRNKQNKFNECNKNHNLSLEMFQKELAENEIEIPTQVEEKELAKKEIQNNMWISDPQEFSQAISKTSRPEVLTPYSIAELNQMKLFKLKNFDIGFALKKHNGNYSEIVSVFNNEPNIKGIGEMLIKSSIKNGGCYLDHFDGFLSGLYSKLGFEEIDRDTYNPMYDENNTIKNKYGEVDVVYRKHKNCN